MVRECCGRRSWATSRRKDEEHSRLLYNGTGRSEYGKQRNEKESEPQTQSLEEAIQTDV